MKKVLILGETMLCPDGHSFEKVSRGDILTVDNRCYRALKKTGMAEVVEPKLFCELPPRSNENKGG